MVSLLCLFQGECQLMSKNFNHKIVQVMRPGCLFRETIAPGIEPSDIDWESVATALAPAEATTLPAPSRIDIQTLLREAQGGTPKRVLPALLEPKLPDNLREPKVFCYYTNWSYKRPGMGQFTPEDIDPELCTHVVFAFASIDNNRHGTSFERPS